MGQYYHAVLERQGKENYSVFIPEVNGEWQGLKLCEHSWFKNDFMSIISLNTHISLKHYHYPQLQMGSGDS